MAGKKIVMRTGEALAEADAKTKIDHEVLFKTHREATFNAIRKAMTNEPSIDWLLENQKKVGHSFHELAVKGDL